MKGAPCIVSVYFFFNDTATTEIYTLSLHDALPILTTPVGSVATSKRKPSYHPRLLLHPMSAEPASHPPPRRLASRMGIARSEEHTSELQSRQYLVCRLLLEKKKKNEIYIHSNQYKS